MRRTRTLALWTTVAAFAMPAAQAPAAPAAAHSDRSSWSPQEQRVNRSSWSPRVHRHVVVHHRVLRRAR